MIRRICFTLCLVVFAHTAFAQETEKKSQDGKDKQEQTEKKKETKQDRRKRKRAERLKKQEEERKKQEMDDADKSGDTRGNGDADQKDQKKAESKNKKDDKKKELTLENLFPDKSMFGSRASRPAFSNDGRFAAYLYRPCLLYTSPSPRDLSTSRMPSSA